MRRRRKLPPDTRPKWDDPDLRDAKNFSAADKQFYAQYNLIDSRKPQWRNDPTYDLRKRRISSSLLVPH